MTFKSLLPVPLVALCIFQSALAQEERPYDASISLGYVGTTGNTETRTFNTQLDLDWRHANWVHQIKFQGLASSEDNRTRAERYYLEDKSDFTISDTDYVYLKGSYTDDRFSGYDYQAAVSGGYGHYFYDREDFELEAFAGMGYRQNALASGENESEVIILSIGQDLSWQISDSSRLTQSLTSEIGEDLTVTRFDIGLTTQIIDRISTKIAFQARHISEAPVGIENTDTQTSISLVYDF